MENQKPISTDVLHQAMVDLTPSCDVDYNLNKYTHFIIFGLYLDFFYFVIKILEQVFNICLHVFIFLPMGKT